jgi:hypothetical protein
MAWTFLKAPARLSGLTAGKGSGRVIVAHPAPPGVAMDAGGTEVRIRVYEQRRADRTQLHHPDDLVYVDLPNEKADLAEFGSQVMGRLSYRPVSVLRRASAALAGLGDF